MRRAKGKLPKGDGNAKRERYGVSEAVCATIRRQLTTLPRDRPSGGIGTRAGISPHWGPINTVAAMEQVAPLAPAIAAVHSLRLKTLPADRRSRFFGANAVDMH